MTKYEKLFEPIKIGQLEIKNRIVFAPLCNTGMLNPDGSFTQQAVEYYRERVKGGAGLIVSGAAKVENEVEKIVPGHNGRAIISISSIPRITEIAEICHYYDAKFFVQLFAGDGYNNPLPGPVGPSSTPSFFRKGESLRSLSIGEIEKIVDAFGNASVILNECGVDGVEINGHEGYLLDDFSASIWNKRTDRYGGNLRGRLNFAKEIYENIRLKAGESFVITYKYGLKHFIQDYKSAGFKEGYFKEAGRDIEEGIEMAKLLADFGYQSLIIDAGCYDSMYWVHPTIYQEHGYLVKFAELVKKTVDIPVIAIGSLDIPDLAEKVLSEKKADMIALGRSLLADPYWPLKVRKGETGDIRPCIGCNEGCLSRALKEKTLSCTVNPEAGFEIYYKLKPAIYKKKVIVIGGGIAGMEAARVLTLREHNVTIYEKSDKLGGHLVEASVPDFKNDIKRLLDWYIKQIEKLKIKVMLSKEVTPDIIAVYNPDVVICSTGSFNKPLNISGIEKQNVIYATDLLLNELANYKIGLKDWGISTKEEEIIIKQVLESINRYYPDISFKQYSKKIDIGDKIIVVGGGMIGLEVALWIAKKGKKVTVIEMLPEVAKDGTMSNVDMILDLLKYYKVEIKTNIELREIKDKFIKIYDREFKTEYSIEYDNLVLSTGLAPNNGLFKQLKNDFPEMDIFAIGDCKKPGKIINAIWDAYYIARSI